MNRKARTRRFIRNPLPIAALALVCTPSLINGGNGGQSVPQVSHAAAPQPVPQTGFRQGGYTLRLQRNEVLVDVRVFDKKGRPVSNLKPGDFHIYEDGIRQKINSFDLEDVDKLAQADVKAGTPAVIDLNHLPTRTPLKQIIQDHRMIVLFLDLTSMPADDLMRAISAASHFVSKQMTPADLVSLVTYTSDLQVVQNFTNDRSLLNKALKDIEIGNSSDLSQQGETGTAGGLDLNGNTIVTQDTSEAFTPDETEFNLFNTDEKLAAIQSLSETLSAIPGRKNVIQFSSGIEQTGIENQAQLRATIDAANRANVSLYTVDARGLLALPPGGDASSASPSGIGIYTNQAVSSEVTSLHEGRETLATLATETGGRTFYDMNDFSQAFRDVQTLNSSYYLLGYTPTDSRSNGKFRHIRVTVDVAGVKVEARPGYYAPKNFRQFTKEDKDAQLEQAMDLESPFVELPLAVEASYFLRPDQKYNVVLAAKIPGSAISFLQKSGIHRTEFDFAWRATDSKGHIAAAMRDTLRVKLRNTTYEQVMSGNILYEGGFVLPPGQYKLKAVVRENESGKLGTFEEPLALPQPGGANLEISSVVVSNQLENASARGAKKAREGSKSAGQPLVVGNQAVLPSVTRVFRADQNLYVYLESYWVQNHAGKQSNTANTRRTGFAPSRVPPRFALVFFRGNVQVSEAGPFAGRLEKSKDQTSTYFTKIPLEKFPPGRYWMQVNVLDPSADNVAFARIPMAIMPPSTKSSATPRGP
jgi:VWFA-related protein